MANPNVNTYGNTNYRPANSCFTMPNLLGIFFSAFNHRVSKF